MEEEKRRFDISLFTESELELLFKGVPNPIMTKNGHEYTIDLKRLEGLALVLSNKLEMIGFKPHYKDGTPFISRLRKGHIVNWDKVDTFMIDAIKDLHNLGKYHNL